MSNSLAAHIFCHVQEQPDQVALVCGAERVSYRDFWLRVTGVVDTLQANGVSRGDCAGLFLENSIECAVQLVAAAAMGIAIAPLPGGMMGSARQRALATARCSVAIAAGRVAQDIRNDPMLSLVQVFAVGAEVPGCVNLDCVGEAADELLPPPDVSLDEPFIITMTSGSTGAPKPIVFSQATKLNRAFDATRDVYGLGDNEVILISTPMHHSLAQRSTLLPLLLGGTGVILERFTPQAWVEAVRDYGVTFLFAVSSQLKTLVPYLQAQGEEIVSLNTVVSSSALLDDETKERLLSCLKCDLHECYGTSEIGCATDFSVSDAQARLGSVGRALPHVSMKITSADRQAVPNGEIGEIAVKTTTAFSGYFGQDDVTRAAYDDEGYFYTGDLGYVDDAGWLFFKGRSKEVIITGGINVYPKDIEDVLFGCEGIADCAVIGVDDEYFGEAILAVLVWEEGIKPNLAAVQRLCMSELADYQRPMAYEMLDALPRNAMGKINKPALLEQFKGYDATRLLRAVLLGDSGKT
jgi:long-chain acyl-CoA synthetase